MSSPGLTALSDAEEVNNEVLDLQAKTVNYGKIIAKDLPTVQSLHLPKKINFECERKLAVIKKKMMDEFESYN